MYWDFPCKIFCTPAQEYGEVITKLGAKINDQEIDNVQDLFITYRLLHPKICGACGFEMRFGRENKNW